MKFQVVLEPAGEGGFTVTVPALDGCFTEGDTVEESLENAKEAIHCYLEGLEKLNEIKARPESMSFFTTSSGTPPWSSPTTKRSRGAPCIRSSGRPA